MLYSIGDCSKVWFEGQQIIIPGNMIGFNWTNQGPLAFGGVSPTGWTFTKYTYIAGYVNTTFAAPASAGSSTITVADPKGIIADQRYRITDGSKNEWVHVDPNYTYGDPVVTLSAPLAFSHDIGATFFNLPNVIKEACILITNSFLKMRGDSSTTMQYTTQPTGNVPGSIRYGTEIQMALDMVNKYRRIR
jgi:hypothetical protein